MSTTYMSVQQVISDPAVDMALTMTARMFGLPKETVITIVQVELPMMAGMAASNPELFKRMYATVRVTLPEPIEDF